MLLSEVEAIDEKQLKDYLHYSPETGLFTVNCIRWGGGKKGSMAGYINKDGYIAIKLDGKSYLAHRLAFLYVQGKFPETIPDHINGIRTDNRWENLREISTSQNCLNRKLSSRNKLGIKGVMWHPSRKAYRVGVTIDGKLTEEYFKVVDFPSSEAALQYATNRVKILREELHKDFAKHR